MSNTFKIDGIEYKFVKHPTQNCLKIARVDGLVIENRKEICRRFLKEHGWKDEDFGNKNTITLEREIQNIIDPKISAFKKDIVKKEISEVDQKLILELQNQRSNLTFTKEMVEEVLTSLAKKDHFFVSEAHLQTEFIIEAARKYPNYKYYPELAPSIIPKEYKEMYHDKGIHFDLIIKGENEKILIEFKYLTNTYSEVIDNMLVSVKSHMALDIRRYDCWKDIERIEAFVKSNETDVSGGYFILVSNVPAFWNLPRSKSLDYEFHIYEGLHKAQIKNWKQGASEGTIKKRNKPIIVSNNYYFEYKPFYKSKERNSEFKYLVVEISK